MVQHIRIVEELPTGEIDSNIVDTQDIININNEIN